MIPFNDISRVLAPYQEQLKDCAREVIDSSWYVLGRKVKQFENEFADFVGTSHCLGVGNGTDALEIALRSIGVERGDEVITVANAGYYTTTACVLIGAVPVYADIDSHLLISEEDVLSKITSKTKAIVVTHLYGQAVDVSKLKKAAPSIAILEDCSQAHGAKVGQARVGSFGDVSVFSFYPTKNLGALGDGAAICTSDSSIAETITKLRQYGWTNKYQSTIAHGRNSRLDELQAGFLSVLLPHLDDNNRARMDILDTYRQAAPSMFTHLLDGDRNVAHLACALTHNRDEFRRFFDTNEISTDIHFPILDNNQESMSRVPFRAENLNRSNALGSDLISVPCYPRMPSEDIDLVASTLAKWNDQFPYESS